jgi:hypothetical protein
MFEKYATDRYGTTSIGKKWALFAHHARLSPENRVSTELGYARQRPDRGHGESAGDQQVFSRGYAFSEQ